MNELIYMADNLAAFPYQTLDEPLFVIHKLDMIVSVSGSNVLQSYREVNSYFLAANRRFPSCSVNIGVWFVDFHT